MLLKVHTGFKVIHKWVREGETGTGAYHNLLYFINCNILVGSSPRLGFLPVVFSLVVHFYCI